MRVLLVRRGEAFAPAYVASLIGQIRAFHPEAEVVCLTDRADTPGTTQALRTDLPGWWAKMELFAPWNANLRPALYLDLDTLVVGRIEGVPDDRFAMLADLDRRTAPRKASGVMALPADTGAIWRDWDRELAARLDPYGDGKALQPFCEAVLQDTVPGIVSWKLDDCRAAPKGRIVCFHGRPRPHEAGGWAERYWSDHVAAGDAWEHLNRKLET